MRDIVPGSGTITLGMQQPHSRPLQAQAMKEVHDMPQSQFRIAEDARLYALIERYPWILATPPVPPGMRLVAPTLVPHGAGVPPAVFKP
jgi:hypothetical protein